MYGRYWIQIESRVYFVFSYARWRREELLVASQISQVRAAEHEIMLYDFIQLTLQNANLDTGMETVVRGLSFSVKMFLSMFVYSSFSQSTYTKHLLCARH